MKNWKDISDQELDDLFKKAAGNKPTTEFRDSDWDSFTAMTPPKNKPILGIFLLAILLGIGITGAYVYWNNSSYKDTDLTQNTSSVKEEEKDSKMEESIRLKAQNLGIPQSDKDKPKEVEPEKPYNLTKKNQVAATDIPKSMKANLKHQPGSKKVKEYTSLFAPNNSIVLKKNSGIKRNGSSTEFGAINDEDIATPQPSEIIYYEKKAFLSVSMLSSLLPNHKIPAIKEITSPSFIPINKEKEASTKSTVSEFYISVGYSPDFSAVIKNAFLRMGHNWSLMTEYQFAKRWRVQGGVISSTKHYQSNFPNMPWPAAWGSKPDGLMEMKASCNVLDIPINLRFDLKNTPNVNMYILGGVSSFIMLNEQYDGFSLNGEELLLQKSWLNQKSFNPASMANVSLGLERKIGERFYLQVEPFIKAPLGTFGNSQVRLATAGVFLNGKIRLSK